MVLLWIAGVIIVVGVIATWIYAVWDMFKRKDLSGWQVALWLLAIILFPLLGLLVYIIARPPAGEVYYKGETVE